jgi:hypothetical protein
VRELDYAVSVCVVLATFRKKREIGRRGERKKEKGGEKEERLLLRSE